MTDNMITVEEAAEGLGNLFGVCKPRTNINETADTVHRHLLYDGRPYSCSQHTFLLPEGEFTIGWEMSDSEKGKVTRQYFALNWQGVGHICRFRHRDKRGRFKKEFVLFSNEFRQDIAESRRK